jgi:hypothetical protein
MRRTVIFAALVLVAVVAGYAAYWHAAANTLAEGIERWAVERRAEGYEIAYAAPDIGGFPLRLEARLDTPVIAAPPASGLSGPQTWRWQGPALLLHARPWAPLDAEASAPGRHDIEIGSGEGARRYVLDATTATGAASFGTDGRLSEATIALTDLLATEEGAEDRTLLAEAAELHAAPGAANADHTQPSLEFRIALAGIVLPPDAATPLGREVEKLEADGAVMGRIAGNAFGDDARLRDALAIWRDDGGTLELTRVVGYWGPLELTGSATFALDAALQPIGAMSATIAGHEATIDALVAAGTVSPRDGSLAKILLAVLSKPSPVDGQPELTAPLTLQNGYLWVGPAKLLRLPVIEWP